MSAPAVKKAGSNGGSDGVLIHFEDVSKFYGEVLGVNRVDLEVEPGITALVGPNGSGKSTLMNLMTGLLRPTQGTVRVLGQPTTHPERLFGSIGYCTQFDAFPRGLTGLQFIVSYLRLHGYDDVEAEERAWRSLERVQLADAAKRKVAGYSKGMRQRVKLAQAMAHDPRIMVLDEPLNGLDPMARAELIGLFKELAAGDNALVVSSHILHEVDVIADNVVLLNQGYVVAEGDIPEVREEMVEHPLQIMIGCSAPAELAKRCFEHPHVVEVTMLKDRSGLLVKTRHADKLYLLLNELVAEGVIDVEAVAPADDDVLAVYEYLIGSKEATL